VDESDPKAWKETLAILVTYATADEFASLSDSLATRLKEVGKDSKAATLCYICAGNVDRTVQIWLEEDAKAAGTPSMKLQSLIEKISVLLVLDVCKQEVVPGIVGDKYAEYAEVLASQGRLAMAMEYLLRANASNSTAAAVLRERIFNSDARNAFSVPQNQHPPFPFEFHNVGVAPARPKVQQPLSSGSAPQAQVFNAVADAFGDAFGAPMQPQQQAVPQAAPQPAQPQQPAPSAYAQAQQAFAASQPTQLQQHQQQATSYSAVPEQQPVNYAAQPQPQAVNYGGAAPQQPQATNYGAVPQQPQPQAVAPQATNYGVAAQAINYGGAPIQQLQQPQANNYGAAPASAPAPAPMQPQQQPHMPQATNYGATPQSAAVNYGAAPAPTPAPAAQPPAVTPLPPRRRQRRGVPCMFPAHLC
jgi:protein transport protein SEC31